MITAIIGWLTLWFGSWSIWLYLVKKGINYIQTYRIALFYFLFLCLVVWRVYKPPLTIFFLSIPLNIFPFYLLAIFFIIASGIYYFSRRIFDKEMLHIYKHKPHFFFAAMSYKFLLAKSFDIAFQQLLFLSLVTSLSQWLHPWQIITTSALLFGSVHLPLFVIKRTSVSVYFTCFSFIAGGLFSTLILTLPYGFVYSYIVHWSFYISAAIMLNMHVVKKRQQETLSMIQ